MFVQHFFIKTSKSSWLHAVKSSKAQEDEPYCWIEHPCWFVSMVCQTLALVRSVEDQDA